MPKEQRVWGLGEGLEMVEGEAKAVEPRILARFPRAPRGKGKPEEIRIAVGDYGGETLCHVRTFIKVCEPSDDSDGWQATKAGAVLHQDELRAAHGALGAAIALVEAAGRSTTPSPGGWRPRKRRPPIASEVRRLRTYAEPTPFDDPDIPFERTGFAKSFRPREQWVIEQIRQHHAAKAKGEPTQFPDEVMEAGLDPRPSDWDDDLPWE
jgi:hypothetical protein